jgi:hypothetical protein
MHDGRAAALIVLALGLTNACDSSRPTKPTGGRIVSIEAGSSAPIGGRGGATSLDAGSRDAGTGDAEVTGSGGATSTFGLQLDGGVVSVSEIYRLCSNDADCKLVSTSCNGCCEQDAITRGRQSQYAEELAVACAGYEGPVCDCELKPVSARCISARCRALDDSQTCYSPIQNLERTVDPAGRGCPCEIDGQGICVDGLRLVCQPTLTTDASTLQLEWQVVRGRGCEAPTECAEIDRRPTPEACLREYQQCGPRHDGTYCGNQCYGALDCSAVACEEYQPISASCDPEGGPWEGVCSDGSIRYRITHSGETRYWNRESGALIGFASTGSVGGACNGSDSPVLLGDASLLTRCKVLTDDGTSVCLQDRCSDTAATRSANGCELELSAPLPTNGFCRAVVELNGQLLPCNDPNGWTGLDRFHIRLEGDACNALLASDATSVRVRVPCSDLPL